MAAIRGPGVPGPYERKRGNQVNAKDWRKKAAVKLTLPSGMVVQARRPGPQQLAEWAALPGLFGSAATDPANISAEQVAGTAALMRQLLVYCCVSPRISETAAADADDEIRPSELPQEDWLFIVRWGLRMGEAEALRPFRPERANDGGGDGGENVLTETKHVVGSAGPGAGAGAGPGGDGAAGGAAGAGK